jgi:3-oxoacyl-[acyl-carrier protein] reductase
MLRGATRRSCMTDLKGRRYIITGGSRGIGRAIAAELATRGARVAVTGRDADALRRAAEEIGAVAIPADVGVEEDCVRSVKEAVAALGGLDGLVNNAGIGEFMPVEALDMDAFRRVYAVNVFGPAIMTREVIPHLRKAGGGDIVNVSSTSGLKGGKHSTIYSSSKFALRSMTECWQAELRPENVRVILVNPSYVQTEFGGASRKKKLEAKFLHPEDIAHAVAAALTMERRGFIPEVTVFATNPF